MSELIFLSWAQSFHTYQVQIPYGYHHIVKEGWRYQNKGHIMGCIKYYHIHHPQDLSLWPQHRPLSNFSHYNTETEWSHSIDYTASCLLECDAVSFGRWVLTFRGTCCCCCIQGKRALGSRQYIPLKNFPYLPSHMATYPRRKIIFIYIKLHVSTNVLASE